MSGPLPLAEAVSDALLRAQTPMHAFAFAEDIADLADSGPVALAKYLAAPPEIQVDYVRALIDALIAVHAHQDWLALAAKHESDGPVAIIVTGSVERDVDIDWTRRQCAIPIEIEGRAATIFVPIAMAMLAARDFMSRGLCREFDLLRQAREPSL